MKNKIVFTLFICSFFSISLLAQNKKGKSPKKGITEVYSMTLKTDFGTLFPKYNLKPYFNYSGRTVKPQDGYKMFYDKNRKEFVLTSIKSSVDEGTLKELESYDGSIELDNAVINCSGCWDQFASCDPGVTASGGSSVDVGCLNPCEFCSIFITLPSKNVSGFETAEGNFGF